MRILPDACDLINLTEHGQPIGVAAFQEYVRAHDHQIVLTFTNVRELAGPLAVDGDFLRVRSWLQSLEAMPHTYMQEVTIVKIELQSAVEAFTSGTEYTDVSPYVTRWDRTIMSLEGDPNPMYDRLIGLRLDEIVFDVFRFQPQAFEPPRQHLPTLTTLLTQDRDLLRAGKVPARLHFVNSVKKHAHSHGVKLPEGREDEFARWVHLNPDRCPGLRLNHETYRQLMSNYDDAPEVGDFSDLAHVFAVPYAEAATLDNRMRDYCSRASRRLVRLGSTVDYRQRLYRDLQELMQKNP